MNPKLPAITMSFLLLTACSKKGEDAAPPGSTVGNYDSSYTNSSIEGEIETTTGLNEISTTDAKSIVLKRANVTENQIDGYKIMANYEKGYLEYDVVFWVDTIEHFYTLLGSNGSVISFFTVFHESGYDPSADEVLEEEGVTEQEFVADSDKLTLDQVKALIAEHALIGVPEMKNVIITEGYNGSIPQYQVTFATETTSYLYYIAATTGMIFSSDKELITVADDPYMELEQEVTTPDSSTTVPEVSTTPEASVPVTPEVTEPVIPEETVPEVDITPEVNTTPPIYGDQGVSGS